MTVNSSASRGAILCQVTWVKGLPWISRSGGPEPPRLTTISAPLVLTRVRSKPSSNSDIHAPLRSVDSAIPALGKPPVLRRVYRCDEDVVKRNNDLPAGGGCK